MKIIRYAVYYAPPAGEFAALASAWLGWDAEAGVELAPPDLGVDAHALTAEPRRYGFHGTVKPPFRLAEGQTRADLEAGLQALCDGLAPLEFPGLMLRNLDGFLALTPKGDSAPLNALAAQVVAELEPFRAPLTEAEFARRKPERLSPRQRMLLERYGYPYVMEEFRFHLTLSDRLETAVATDLRARLQSHFAQVLAAPFRIDELCLFGEAEGGRFHLLSRHALRG